MADRALRFDLLGRDKTLGRTLAKGERDVERFSRSSSQSFKRGAQEAQRSTHQMGASIKGFAGIAAGAFAAAGVAQFAKDSVILAAEFDKTMRQVGVATKTPTSRLKELKDVALDMGAKTSFSAKQAGDAMLELAKGGLTRAQIKAGGLSSTLTLAAAGGLELGTAAGFVVKSLNTFGLRADKAGDAAAALAGGANASVASVEDLGMALSQVGPGAKNAGLSLQETVGVLASFADHGVESSDAGTSLKTMLVNLVPHTAKAAATMKKLGLDFTDAKGAILPITEVAQQLQDKLSGLSEEQRTTALATIFGSDATRAATILMEEGAKGLEPYIAATMDRAAAEELAKTNTEGASGAFERLKGAVETVQIKLGEKFLPVLADVATKIADEVIPNVEKFFTGLRDDLLPHLDRMKTAWDDNKDALGELLDKLVDADGDLESTEDKAKALADTVVGLTDGLGKAAEFLAGVADKLNDVEEASSKAGKMVHDKFIVPTIDGFRLLGTSALSVFGTIIGVMANVAEALHLPAAKALRKAEGGIRDYRIHFNAEMDKLKNEDVLITASPRFQFSKSFTQTDWLAARSAAGRRAMGGPIFGPGTGTSDSVPIWASRGEHVWTAREVTAAGGHGAMERWRQATLRGDVPGFAGGGAIPRHQLGSMPSQVGQFPTARHGIASLMGNWTGGILTAALKKLFTGKPGILNFIRSTDRLPYVWGAAGPGGYDCSGLVSAVLGKMTGRGGGQGQRYFTTASIRPGILGIRSGLGGTLQIGVTPGRGHMAGRYGGLGFEAESTRTGIKIGAAASRPESFARHYHLAKGGAITAAFKPMAELLRREGVAIGGDPGKLRIDRFDRGGWLMPGATLAYNGTGRPEPVGGGGFVWHGDIKVYTTSGDANAIGAAVRRQVVAVLDERARQARKGARA